MRLLLWYHQVWKLWNRVCWRRHWWWFCCTAIRRSSYAPSSLVRRRQLPSFDRSRKNIRSNPATPQLYWGRKTKPIYPSNTSSVHPPTYSFIFILLPFGSITRPLIHSIHSIFIVSLYIDSVNGAMHRNLPHHLHFENNYAILDTIIVEKIASVWYQWFGYGMYSYKQPVPLICLHFLCGVHLSSLWRVIKCKWKTRPSDGPGHNEYNQEWFRWREHEGEPWVASGSLPQ